MEIIKSKENKIFKFSKSLLFPRTRKKKKAYLLEGKTFVEEALKEYQEYINFLILSEDVIEKAEELIKTAKEKEIPIYIFHKNLIKEIATTQTSPGIFAVIKEKEFFNSEKILEKIPNIVLILEELQDPTNVGAIIRVADAVGVSAVFYTKGTADPYSPKSVRSGAGSILHVPLFHLSSIEEIIDYLKKYKFQIVATVVKEGKNIFYTEFKEKVAIVVGNEARGVSQKVKEMADLLLTIPIIGKAQSLNVAVATGVILYKILAERNFKT